MSWNALLTGEIRPDDLGSVESATFSTEDEYDDREAMLADAARFEAVVVGSFEVDERFLDAADALRIVAKRGVGVDNIDVEAATERGVLVANTPGANARAVAEHALALLLSVRHRIVAADREVRAGGWAREPFVTAELEGDTLGVLGAGDTGRTLAGLADGIGMTVLTYDPYVDAGALPAGVDPVGTKAALFERADVVSVHTPLTAETRNAVGAAELARLGTEGILLNTARGGVVDETALIEALEAGTVAGAGLDVYGTEPPDGDHPLFDRDDVVVTPHVAGWTVEANAEKNRRVVATLRAVRRGEVPDDAINPEAVER